MGGRVSVEGEVGESEVVWDDGRRGRKADMWEEGAGVPSGRLEGSTEGWEMCKDTGTSE